MQLRLISGLFWALQAVFANPPPEHSRVLVIVDDVDADIGAEAIADPLKARGFDVIVGSVKRHPQLVEYGERTVDNIVIAPGKTKALGSTLRARDLLEFMGLGGNVIALTTPKHSPAALRELAAQLGIEVSGRGIESRNAFEHKPYFPLPDVFSTETAPNSAFEGGAVAKLGSNPYTLGLLQAPSSAFAFNAAKEDGEGNLRPESDAFGAGGELYAAAALQSLEGARFVWIGTPDLLTGELGEQITGWAFQERGKLRIANASHSSLRSGESLLHYSVSEPLRYCAQVEQWIPELSAWVPFSPEDAQVEFSMLDPFYRLPLSTEGCVEFLAPNQYGMFTFSLDYKRPGRTFLSNKQVVTVRHRANDEWDRSWTITNSWVYLSGVSTTVIGFVLFVFIYLFAPEMEVVKKVDSEKTKSKRRKTKTDL